MKCIFKEYRCTPPIAQKYRKGSALLAVVLILAVISSMLSVGTAKLTQAAINSTSTNKITLQAQQYAASKADIVKATKYDELTAQNKTVISNSDGFYDEVSISAESEYPGNSNISQRECIIRVYKDSEALPRSSLFVTLFLQKLRAYRKALSSHGTEIKLTFQMALLFVMAQTVLLTFEIDLLLVQEMLISSQISVVRMKLP